MPSLPRFFLSLVNPSNATGSGSAGAGTGGSGVGSGVGSSALALAVRDDVSAGAGVTQHHAAAGGALAAAAAAAAGGGAGAAGGGGNGGGPLLPPPAALHAASLFMMYPRGTLRGSSEGDIPKWRSELTRSIASSGHPTAAAAAASGGDAPAEVEAAAQEHGALFLIAGALSARAAAVAQASRVRVFVYDMPSDFNTEPAKDPRCSQFMFRSEQQVHKRLLTSRMRTRNASEATFFYLPVYSMCHFDPKRPGDIRPLQQMVRRGRREAEGGTVAVFRVEFVEPCNVEPLS